MDIAQKNLVERITTNPAIFGGKPIIRGMRFSVNDVLEMKAGGMSDAEILEDFPYLEADDIKAVLTFEAHGLNRVKVQ